MKIIIKNNKTRGMDQYVFKIDSQPMSADLKIKHYEFM